jgi:glutathione S-transferase
MSDIVLWGAGTVRTLRAHWVLAELGLEYECKPIGSRTGETQTDEFSRLNPKQKIPVLVDGDLVLSESAAIVTYLADTYGTEQRLTPAPGSLERAHYDEWVSFILMELDAHTLYVMRRHRDLANLYGEAPNAIAAAIEGFRKQVAVAEARLDESAFLLGDWFSAADLLLTTCLEWAHLYGVDLTAPLFAFKEQQKQRPAYQAAFEANFKDVGT